MFWSRLNRESSLRGFLRHSTLWRKETTALKVNYDISDYWTAELWDGRRRERIDDFSLSLNLSRDEFSSRKIPMKKSKSVARENSLDNFLLSHSPSSRVSSSFRQLIIFLVVMTTKATITSTRSRQQSQLNFSISYLYTAKAAHDWC